MKRAVIICNGNRPIKDAVKKYSSKNTTLICANGGTKHAVSLGYIPDVIIGDHDSLPKNMVKKLTAKHTHFISYPKEKDETDAQLAIQFAIEKRFTEIIVFGIYGTRIDHFLSILLFIAEQKVPIKMVEGNQEIYCVTTNVHISGSVGDIVSLIPLKEDVQGITTKGLLYPLRKESLKYGKTQGVSNELTQPEAEIQVKKGVLLGIHTVSV